jgi:hypothetical protein
LTNHYSVVIWRIEVIQEALESSYYLLFGYQFVLFLSTAKRMESTRNFILSLCRNNFNSCQL